MDMGGGICNVIFVHEHAWWVLRFCRILRVLTRLFCAAALVAMRVHALHGGPKRLKVILWICGIVYALTTMALLGVGLYVRQREYSRLMVFIELGFAHASMIFRRPRTGALLQQLL